MDTSVLEKVDIDIATTKQWRVVFHNDNKTSMEFVIAVLVKIFNLDFNKASQLMMQVHEQGSATVATYSNYDIAEQKTMETLEMAKRFEYPLKVTIEQ